MEIRVLIADDHPIVRDGICGLLHSHLRINVVFVASTFADIRTFLETPAAANVDVMVLDIGGMGDSPISFITGLYRQPHNYRVIVFSSNVNLAPDLKAIGVHGYIGKEEMGQHLLTAIEVVAGGGTYFSPIVEEYLEVSASVRQTFQLAPREVSVLHYLSEGCTTLQIANHLQIEEETTQNYISKLRRKLHCHSRTQLVNWYRQMYLGDVSGASHKGLDNV